MTDKSEQNDEADSEGNLLSAAVENLSLKQQKAERPTKAIATNEFYYGLDLQNIERLSAESSSRAPLPAPKKAKREKSRKDRKMEKLSKQTNVQLPMPNTEMKNLRINNKNEKAMTAQSQEAPKKKNKSEPSKQQETGNPLLARLKMLQSGQLTSVQLQKSSPLPRPPKKEAQFDKEEEMQRNKEEVQRLNLQIQQKIGTNIKPRLRKILGHQENGTANGLHGSRRAKTSSESSQSAREPPKPIARVIQKPTREVPIVKTPVKTSQDEEVEIYRYTHDDLNQLQSTATYELVPKLKDLNLCGRFNSELDAFLLKLVSIQDDAERTAAILHAAEHRKLIVRSGPRDFKFSTVPIEPQKLDKVERIPRKMNEDKEMKKHFAIETIKSRAKSDDEINEKTYLYEFSCLFEDAIKDQDMSQPLESIVQKLIDNKQAYIIDGEIRINGKNNQEAYVTHPKRKKDVCVSKLILRKHAFQGDYVKVLVNSSSDSEDALETSSDDVLNLSNSQDEPANRNFGCVLHILQKRHSRRVIGSIVNDKKKETRHVSFAVRDPKIPNVRIGNDGVPKDIKITDKMLMVVQITSWCHDQPKGKIIEIIGEKDQLKAENAAILIQHNLDPQPFTQEIIDRLPAAPFVIPDEEFKYREDLRKKCIFSIDPETARDLDDALSCEVLPSGNLEVGVHISDVSYFLKENSELDEIVKEKATTIYLVDQVYHMLPVPLCLLCSLLPGADKMAYSVFWEMNPETAEIINTRFTRSIMNSCGKLSYDHAQMVIDKTDHNWSELEKDFPEVFNGFNVSDVASVIVKLQKLAVVMRNKRKENGALKIDQPKISFRFDKDDQRMEAPIDFFQYITKDSNRLIEEFMLLANISVATFIYEKFPKISLLRNHDAPKEEGLKKLVATLQKQGIELETGSSFALSASMERNISNAPEIEGMNAALNLMVSKTMTRARYFCSDSIKDVNGFSHYALSIPMYTHFTSPIRRYADVLVHRVLNAALGYEDPPCRTPDEVDQLANVSNAQKYSAKVAGEDSSNLYFMQFIKSLKTKTMLASVIGFYDFNLEVVLIETGHVLKLHYKKMQFYNDVIIKPFIDNSPPYITIIWKDINQESVIHFGSEIMIQVEVLKDKLNAHRIFYHSL